MICRSHRIDHLAGARLSLMAQLSPSSQRGVTSTVEGVRLMTGFGRKYRLECALLVPAINWFGVLSHALIFVIVVRGSRFGYGPLVS